MSSFQGCLRITVFASWLESRGFSRGVTARRTGKPHRTDGIMQFPWQQRLWGLDLCDRNLISILCWPSHYSLSLHTHTPLPFYLTLSLAKCPLLYRTLSAWCIMCLEQNNLNYCFVPMQRLNGFMQCEITHSHYKICDKIHKTSSDESIRLCIACWGNLHPAVS